MVRIVDMKKLQQVTIDEEVTSYQVRWDNTLVIAAYDRERTFILTVEGKRIIVRQRLNDILNRFAEENVVHKHEMTVLYDRVGCRTRGYIAGHYRLVPTCGTSNQQVVYYMAHLMDHAIELVDDKRVLLVMMTSVGMAHVRVDTGYRTFRRIKAAADKVAKIQLRIYENCRQQYGKMLEAGCSERPYESEYCVIQDRRELSEEILKALILYVAETAYFETYGEKIDSEFLEQIKRVINRF